MSIDTSASPRGRVDRSAPMPLADHLRELRNRLLVSLLAITAGAVVGWIFFEPIFSWVTQPFLDVVAQAQAEGKNVQLALTGVTDPFTLRVKVALAAGFVIASPVWLFELWRFVTPGLHTNERRWAVGFAAVATPLFLSGVALAYTFLPQALGFLFGFTPDGVANIVDVTRYMAFFLQTIVIFGIGFLLPLMAVLLNFAGVLPAATFIGAWRYITLGAFVFASMATPDGSPLTMLALATPMLLLVALGMFVALLNDRRRARRGAGDEFADDEASPTPVAEPTPDITTVDPPA